MTECEVYLQQDRWNPVCQATIPGAWVVVTKHGEVAICHPWDAKDAAEARAIWKSNN